VEVKMIINSATLGLDGATYGVSGTSSLDRRYFWPLLLQVASHPLITMYSGAEVEHIEGEKGNFNIKVLQYPRYIHKELCTACSRCESECSAKVTTLVEGQKITHGAIHKPVLSDKTVPSAYIIQKNGFAPCRVACPLGVNVQGFISLLSKGKTDKALALISEAAPFGGVLGRVCRHPCEANCNRAKVDSPVSIRALHRYAADRAPGGIKYSRRLPARSREDKIAIVGSGPAGLTAAWELTRRGYSTTVFESHGVIGGMLATGIPRFRLPREVREREIAAIRNLGVDIRTGITVGRDVTFSYLKERGYRAFFLSIGTQQNNKLNIPGEGLDGVVDCMSLLITLNLMVETFMGSNIVIIGDGNTAIDSARAAIRRNRGTVKVLSWTVPEEITANEEELKEALQEGVTIEYCSIPVEILADNGKVAGIHCQRTRLTDNVMANGRHLPEPIPGADFILDADHVVVAIGQSPNALQLSMSGLAIDSNTGVIAVNPLTLETGITGVFAGGDCVTGPNNVVEAMAAGLRAAESIDRYFQGSDLEVGRSFEPPPIAEIDLESMEILPYKRATMPVIRLQKRLNSYEETTIGLVIEAAQREAQRCLNCAFCSQCMECSEVCELGAVFHDDAVSNFEIGAQAILKFPSGDSKESTIVGESSQEASVDNINVISPGDNDNVASQVTRAMAAAFETATDLKLGKGLEYLQGQRESEENVTYPDRILKTSVDSKRMGVFLCSCGGSISSVIDFKAVTRRLAVSSGVTCVQEIAQACTEAGAKQIADKATELQLDNVVLAACRCCNWGQVCYSCTDRRVMCQQYLYQHLVLPYNTDIEFCNIREQCAWAHQDDRKGATRTAAQIISSGIARARLKPPIILVEGSILPGILIIGHDEINITSASALASRGYDVHLVTRVTLTIEQLQADEKIPPALKEYDEKHLVVRPWPHAMKLNGSPGNYEAVLEYGDQSETINIGAILVNMEELNKGDSPILDITSGSGRLGRIISKRDNLDNSLTNGDDLLREITIGETAGIFLIAPDGTALPDAPFIQGLAATVRISSYLARVNPGHRVAAVEIDKGRCRGCGDCFNICSYIEMRERGDGMVYAHIDKALCLGCGVCIRSCPTGAITQPQQSDEQIITTLRSMLRTG
ncbi:FAD-dependent oxidoreductase, partial [Chloroflexota bacterium]